MKKSPRNPTVTTVAQRLRQAFVRQGLDSGKKGFALEFKSVFGEEIPHLASFFNDDGDLPFSDVLRLCQLLDIPLAEMLADQETGDYLQIVSYEGGNAAHVVLPRGLVLSRNDMDELVYWFVSDNLTTGLRQGDVLVCSRITVPLEPGSLYLVEDFDQVRPLYCTADSATTGLTGFARGPDGPAEITLPRSTGLAPQPSDGAVVTGRVLWNISACPPPKGKKAD